MSKRRVQIQCENCGEISTFVNAEPEFVKCLECFMDVDFLQYHLFEEVKPGRNEPLNLDRIKQYAIGLVLAEKQRRYLQERLV